MTLTDVVKEILDLTKMSLTPQEIREIIKAQYPHFYGTCSHISNVVKGHYKDIDHALLAQIYSTIKQNSSFSCDTSVKPMVITIQKNEPKLKLIPKPTLIRDPNQVRNEDDLISNIEHYYKKSLEVMHDFGGPSIYFHIQAIKEQEKNFLSDRHIEMIYATLASWGMHKMGDPAFSKAKLVSFTVFKSSILMYQSRLSDLSKMNMKLCTQKEYEDFIDDLEPIYNNLRVSISEATIVANSKTLAHLLPQMIPPIDRQYTIRFFTQENKDFFNIKGNYKQINLPSELRSQFIDFKSYCSNIKKIFDKCKSDLFSINTESFNTSYPKIMDNLIMAFVKDVPKPKSENLKK